MNISEKNSTCSRYLHDMLLLRYEPVAIKMVEDEMDVPDTALNPKRDLGKHMALCQAYALARRNRKTVYMDKASEWCWCPMVCMGYVEAGPGTPSFEMLSRFIGIGDKNAAEKFFAEFPTLRQIQRVCGSPCSCPLSRTLSDLCQSRRRA